MLLLPALTLALGLNLTAPSLPAVHFVTPVLTRPLIAETAPLPRFHRFAAIPQPDRPAANSASAQPAPANSGPAMPASLLGDLIIGFLTLAGLAATAFSRWTD